MFCARMSIHTQLFYAQFVRGKSAAARYGKLAQNSNNNKKNKKQPAEAINTANTMQKS